MKAEKYEMKKKSANTSTFYMVMIMLEDWKIIHYHTIIDITSCAKMIVHSNQYVKSNLG